MADEIGPLAADAELFRGELPALLTDLLMAQVELAAVAAPWLSGRVDAPVIQLRLLAWKLRDLQAAAQTVGEEVNRVSLETRRRRETARAALEGCSDSSSSNEAPESEATQR